MTTGSTTRADMHCHSSASELSRLGVQRALGLPECATPPIEVYELAKRRGMDFVTITDHDTIDGVLGIAHLPGVFVSEELTASFRGEPQAVHVLCYGISPEEHEWLQAHSCDVELCASYMHEREIACALAHPWYAVGAPLTPRHRRRLAELFPVWETRNGSRSRELNRPAAMYVATLDGIGIGGSDDHAGVDIGRTWTEAPPAETPEEFLNHMRAGRVSARGAQGSPAKWAHAAIVLALRSLEDDRDGRRASAAPDARRSSGVPLGLRRGPVTTAPDPRRVMNIVQRLLREADVRHGSGTGDLTPQDARSLLHAWLAAVGLDHLDARGVIEHVQAEGFTHADLYRRACRAHERSLRAAVDRTLDAVDGQHMAAGQGAAAGQGTGGQGSSGGISGQADALAVTTSVFESCIAAIPYAPAAAFQAREQSKLEERREDGEPIRVAVLADGIGATHGVSRTLQEIRARGVPGFQIEVVGTDPEVDRRMSAVAEVEVPFYPGLSIGVPSLAAAVETLMEGAFDVIHVCSPGPVGVAGVLLARALGLPLVGSYHTELAAYADVRSGERRLAQSMEMALATFYGACDAVLSPSPAADDALARIGVPPERILRWDRGVDAERFSPARRERLCGSEQRIDVLYAGRVTAEKGVDLLADAFLAARAWEPRLHLTIAGGGPEQERLSAALGEHAAFLGWLQGDELARAYAAADMFLFPSSTDTFGQVILEAQASGLPVIAVAAGGPLSLIEDGVSGLLREPEAGALAKALLGLARSPELRASLGAAGRAAALERTWEQTLGRLATGYRRALGEPHAPAGIHRLNHPNREDWAA